MNNQAVINIKTDAKTKKEAQKLAAEFGVSLSSLVTMSLRNIIRNKRIDFSLIPEVEPTKEELQAIKKGLEDVKKGNYITLAEL